MNRQIFNNLKIKLIVVALAILVWFFVKMEDNYRYSFHIPIRVTNLGPRRVIKNDLAKQAKITCWGKGRYLLSLMIKNDIFYNLDVSRVHRTGAFVLERSQVKFFRGNDVEVLNIVEPETVKVILADLLTKNVPINPDVEIQLLPGYTVVDELKLNPDSVEIIGLEPELKTIQQVTTEKKLFKNVKRDLESELQLVNPQLPHVRLLSRKTTLTVDIQKLMEKPLSEIRVTVINQPADLKITVIPSTLSLVLEGGSERLLNISQQDIKAYIDYKKVQLSRSKNHLAYIDTPLGIRYRDVKPKRFNVVVEKIK